MNVPIGLKYRAFLSYAHADQSLGRWLHRELERFRIDKQLAGRVTAIGPVPASLRPIFRDREDFTGGHSLTDATIAALDASATLIVLCSLTAATRPAVNEEVRLFRSRHPERPVIPVILDGKFPDNYPPALRFEVTSEGAVSDRAITILGPDLRETADGRQLSIAKVVAGMVGIGTDEIIRRAERDRRRRLRAWIGGLSAVVVMLAGLTVWAELNRREAVEQRRIANERRLEAERNFSLAKGAADGLVFDIAKGLRSVEGMQAGAVAKILGTARDTLDKLANSAPENLALQGTRTVMLSEFGDTYRAQGNLPAALESYRSALAVADRLATADPGGVGWHRDLAMVHMKIGDALVAQGELSAALDEYNKARGIILRLTTLEASSPSLQRDLSIIEDLIADVLRSRANLPAALVAYRAALERREHLLKSDAGNSGLQREIYISYFRIAQIEQAQGKLAEALAAIGRAHAIAEALSNRETDNTLYGSDLMMAHNKFGELHMVQRNLAGALQSFQASLAIAERLAKADPGNAGWQWNSSAAQAMVAMILKDQGNLPAASEGFRRTIAIQEKLAASDPANAVWQRDLSASHNNYGDALLALNNPSMALDSYRAALAIRERMTQSDPGNAERQYMLALSLQRIGLVTIRYGGQGEAEAAMARGHEIVQGLVRLEPNRTAFNELLTWFESAVAAVRQQSTNK